MDGMRMNHHLLPKSGISCGVATVGGRRRKHKWIPCSRGGLGRNGMRMRNDGRNEGRERGMLLEMGVATQRWCALSRSISQSPSDDDDYECEHRGREKEKETRRRWKRSEHHYGMGNDGNQLFSGSCASYNPMFSCMVQRIATDAINQ